MKVQEYIEKHNGKMKLEEVFQVVNSMTPFDAVQYLNVHLFEHPFNLHSYAEQIIEGKAYCFKFTPTKIYISKRRNKRLNKEILERFTSNLNIFPSEKDKRRSFIQRNIMDLKRLIHFRKSATESDIFPMKVQYFISDMLFKYRNSFDGKFNTCCKKRMIKNMQNSKPHALEFFQIAYREAKKDFICNLNAKTF